MVTLPPPYRNPNNDRPRLGEMIHFVRSGSREAPGIVNAIYVDSMQAFVMPAFGDPETRHLSYDDYDPTEDPVLYSWHFDHF
jgi:hypothetical protein